jgi:transcription antitermination factor NusG
MAKKKLKQIAEEFEIPFEKAQDIAFKHLEEEMVTGRGKNTWINEEGQKVFDSMTPVPVIYRGRVIRLMPNANYVLAKVPELVATVVVKAKLNVAKNLVGKYIYIQAENVDNETKYHHVMPSRR